jgi:hypothetical protein
MARGRRASRTQGAAASAGGTAPEPGTPGSAAPPARLPLPSPVASTNIVIADIVLRAAGGLLRERMEKGLLVRSHGRSKAHRLIEGRGLTTSLALWGASHLARRSPLGLALVAGGLAAKVFYDRGKRLEAERKARNATGTRD